jgi:hypothetical protein
MDKLQTTGSQSLPTPNVEQTMHTQEKTVEETKVVQPVYVEEKRRMTIEEKTGILEQLRQGDISPAVRAALIKMLED